MADRGPVKIREGRIDDLTKLYKQSYKDIVKTIDLATTSGKIQKFKVMAQINRILADLGVNVDEWVKTEIPQYYLAGANQAKQDLLKLGINVDTGTGFAVVNKEAITALVDETSLAFAEGITGISRNARRLLDNALKQQLNFIIADGKLTGAARRSVSASVSAAIQESGLVALVDRGGKQWQFDTYARMLVRTKSVEARNVGLMNRMTGSGHDLVQVTRHQSDHEACAFWEGKILSISGATPVGTKLDGGYVVEGTYEQARRMGLFHPNCKHGINVINPALAAITKAYDNTFVKEPPTIKPTKAAIGKAGGGTVKLTQNGTNKAFKVTKSEEAFIKNTGLSFEAASAGPNSNGYYRASTHTVRIANLKDPGAAKTFYHELGHAIDYRGTAGRTLQSRQTETIRALNKDKRAIVRERLIDYGASKPKAIAYANDQIYDGGRMSTSYRQYIFSRKELFADAYGQYRVDPNRFKRNAPNMFNLFEKGVIE